MHTSSNHTPVSGATSVAAAERRLQAAMISFGSASTAMRSELERINAGSAGPVSLAPLEACLRRVAGAGVVARNAARALQTARQRAGWRNSLSGELRKIVDDVHSSVRPPRSSQRPR